MHRGRRVLGFSHGREGGGSWGLRSGSFSIMVGLLVVGLCELLVGRSGQCFVVVTVRAKL